MSYLESGILFSGVGWALYLVIDGVRDYREQKKSQRRELYRLAEKTGRERLGVGSQGSGIGEKMRNG